MKTKTGILIVNLGTPDAPTTSAVRRYLKEFLLDPRVIDYSWLPRNLLVRGIIAPFRAPSSAKLYQKLWTENGSPLKIYGETVVRKLQEKFGEEAHVLLAMRYQNPSIKSALDTLKKKNVNRIIVFPMFPQYASATTGSIHDRIMKLVSDWQAIPDITFINSYFDHEDLIDIFADNARKMNHQDYDHFVFSFHGVPQRQLVKADHNNCCLQSEACCQLLSDKNHLCYSAQCHATARGIAQKLALDNNRYTISFQSRLGPEKWTQPYTSEVLENLAEKGTKKVLVFSPAFVADCLETTIEIGYEYKEEFIEKGGEKLDLVPSLNDDPRWIDLIYQIITSQ